MMTTLMIANGASFPMMSCRGVMGVTMSCSSVPSSFSFTMDREVSTVVMIMRIMARTPGTMKFLLARVGLYRTRTAGSTCTERTLRRRRGSSAARRACDRATCARDTMSVAYVSPIAADCESEPSARSCSGAVFAPARDLP